MTRTKEIPPQPLQRWSGRWVEAVGMGHSYLICLIVAQIGPERKEGAAKK